MSNILVNTIKDTGNNTLLSSDGSGSVTLGSGFPQNTPSFLAVLITPGQGVDSAAWSRIVCNQEEYDTDSCYNTSTGYFTPNVAGKYYVYGGLRYATSTDFTSAGAAFYKNSTRYIQTNVSQWHYDSNTLSAVIDCNGSTDTISFYTYQDQGSTQQLDYGSEPYYVYFGGYKLIGA
jgi:hypothetical protein